MIIAIESGNEALAGAIVYWRLTGDIDASELNNSLEIHGLEEETIPLPTPRSALRRTLKELCGPDRFLRAGRDGTGNLYLVRQVNTPGGPEFIPLLTANLNGVGQPVFIASYDDAEGVGPFVEDDGPQNCVELEARFWHHVFHVEATDVSSWLIEQARKCDAVPMRQTGGIYFVPRHQIDAWRKRSDALNNATACSVRLVPAVHSDDAVDAVLESLIAECTSFTDALDQDISAGNLGHRALEGRGAKAGDLLKKLGRYEKLLGVTLDEIREQIEEQQANAVQAALAAMEDDA